MSSAAEELARLQLAELRQREAEAEWEQDQARRIAERDEHRARHNDRRPDDDEARPVHVELGADDELVPDHERLPDHVLDRVHQELYGEREVGPDVRPSETSTVEDADGRNKMRVESFGGSYTRFSLEDEV
jgi:hypothetical protein